MCNLTSLCMFAVSFTFIIFPTASFPNLSAIHGHKQACNSPLGIQNGKVPDSHLSASSYYNLYTGSGHVDMKAKYCRLNNKYAWCTNKRKRGKSWVMVDLGRLTNVTAISTQGYSGVGDYYVESFKLAYSINGSSWKFVGKNGTDMVFVGNKHGLDINKNNFDQIQARYVKIFPVTFYIRICLRIELYGCVKGSSIPTTTTTPTTPTPTSPTATSPTAITITQISPTATTPLISTSKIASKTPTTTTITPTPSAITSSITSSITTKATSIKSTATTSIAPSTSSKSASIATSSYTAGTPSHQHTTTVPSSQSVPATSLHPSIESSTVAMTTIKPSKANLTHALHRKSFSDDDEEKMNSIIAGLSILAGLLFLVVFALLIFRILRRRKRIYNVNCQLVDLPEYPYDRQVGPNEEISHSLVELENDSTLIKC